MRGDTIAPTQGSVHPVGSHYRWALSPTGQFGHGDRLGSSLRALHGRYELAPGLCVGRRIRQVAPRATQRRKGSWQPCTPCRRVFDEYSTGLQLPCWRPLWMPSSREPSPTVARVVWSHHRLHHLGAAERRRRRSRIRRRASSRSRVESSVRHPAPLGSGSGVLEPFGTGGMESEYRAITVPVRSVVLPWLAVPPVAALALDRFRLLRPVAVLRRESSAPARSPVREGYPSPCLRMPSSHAWEGRQPTRASGSCLVTKSLAAG